MPKQGFQNIRSFKDMPDSIGKQKKEINKSLWPLRRQNMS